MRPLTSLTAVVGTEIRDLCFGLPASPNLTQPGSLMAWIMFPDYTHIKPVYIRAVAQHIRKNGRNFENLDRLK